MGTGYTGIPTTLQQWTQSSINLGGLIYLKGGNSYFAPEVGVSVGLIETSEMYEEGNLGVHSALKYGYDWHILQKTTWGPRPISPTTTAGMMKMALIPGQGSYSSPTPSCMGST